MQCCKWRIIIPSTIIAAGNTDLRLTCHETLKISLKAVIYQSKSSVCCSVKHLWMCTCLGTATVVTGGTGKYSLIISYAWLNYWYNIHARFIPTFFLWKRNSYDMKRFESLQLVYTIIQKRYIIYTYLTKTNVLTCTLLSFTHTQLVKN